jgi:hypothetical protein
MHGVLEDNLKKSRSEFWLEKDLFSFGISP